MAKSKGPKMVDLDLYIQAGINPKTGLPIKFEDCQDLKKVIKRFLRLIDEQDAVNRYKWYNIPFRLSSEEIERMIYYRGQLCAFYDKDLGQFYLMPYALNGTLDYYGRYNSVNPVPFCSGEEIDADSFEKQKEELSKKVMKCQYDVVLPEDLTMDTLENSCVLLHDYTKQVAQTIVPRWEVNDSILDVMADIVPFLRTTMILGTGIKGIRVNTAEESEDVMRAAKQTIMQARKGEPWIPILGDIQFQDLANGSVAKSEDFLLVMQALDNIRLQGYGLPNGGIFEKKAHILEAEQAMNQQAIDRIYQDGLAVRQRFCNIFNSIYGTTLWCAPSESVLDTDINGDGLAVDMDYGDNNGGKVEEGDRE